jgi:hypothetical protein
MGLYPLNHGLSWFYHGLSRVSTIFIMVIMFGFIMIYRWFYHGLSWLMIFHKWDKN